jgi:hypothetical protein
MSAQPTDEATGSDEVEVAKGALAPMVTPEERTLPLEEIKPYWRNPRRIPDDAVEAVAESIRLYGYQQPIVVDRENVVVVGHTRLLALQRLGFTSATVYVTDLPEVKAREYRLADNKTGEMSSWDYNALVLELREFEEPLLKRFFPEVDLEIGQVSEANALGGPTEAQIAEAGEKVTKVAEADPTSLLTTDVLCPSCSHVFEVRTRSLPGLSYGDLWEMVERHGAAE